MYIYITRIFKARNLVPRDYSEQASKRAHTHTHRHPRTQAFCLYKAKYTQFKTGSKRPGDLEWIKTHGTENMAGQFWEKKCF